MMTEWDITVIPIPKKISKKNVYIGLIIKYRHKEE